MDRYFAAEGGDRSFDAYPARARSFLFFRARARAGAQARKDSVVKHLLKPMVAIKPDPHYPTFMNWQLPRSVLAILTLFGTMMVIVTFTAYSRRSGNTGIDTARMEKLREIASAASESKKN